MDGTQAILVIGTVVLVVAAFVVFRAMAKNREKPVPKKPLGERPKKKK